MDGPGSSDGAFTAKRVTWKVPLCKPYNHWLGRITLGGQRSSLWKLASAFFSWRPLKPLWAYINHWERASSISARSDNLDGPGSVFRTPPLLLPPRAHSAMECVVSPIHHVHCRNLIRPWSQALARYLPLGFHFPKGVLPTAPAHRSAGLLVKKREPVNVFPGLPYHGRPHAWPSGWKTEAKRRKGKENRGLIDAVTARELAGPPVSNSTSKACLSIPVEHVGQSAALIGWNWPWKYDKEASCIFVMCQQRQALHLKFCIQQGAAMSIIESKNKMFCESICIKNTVFWKDLYRVLKRMEWTL